MKSIKIIITFISFSLLSCNPLQHSKSEKPALKKVINTVFQNLLDSSYLDGVILVFDEQHNRFYSNSFQKAEESYLPASTFKIANSIIGLETGIIKSEKSIFKWDGSDRAYTSWEADLSLREAFQRSCVPCYQELARNVGSKKMKELLKILNFGEMSVRDENIDNFWLRGKSKINAIQQIDFLSRFYKKQLPISSSTTETIKNIMRIRVSKNYTLSGKTGLAVSNGKDTGWFVGYVEKGKEVYYFATKITPKSNMPRNEFAPMRKNITLEALKYVGIMKSID